MQLSRLSDILNRQVEVDVVSVCLSYTTTLAVQRRAHQRIGRKKQINLDIFCVGSKFPARLFSLIELGQLNLRTRVLNFHLTRLDFSPVIIRRLLHQSLRIKSSDDRICGVVR